MENIIEAIDVCKKFKDENKDFFALDGINLSVKKGEIFALLGPNGAGKSTLLNVIMHLLLPDKGTVKVFGKKPGIDLYKKIGFVSGEAKFHWALKSKDVLEFYSRVHNIPKEEREKRIAKLVKLFQITDILEKKVEVLSTGERMRLSFAKALLNNPELLILDEPTLGLDPDISISIRDEIKRINKKFGVTILLTSHYMQEVEQLADRIAFIYKGKIIEEGKISTLKIKHFGEFTLEMHTRSAAKGLGKDFTVKGNKISKKLKEGEDLSKLFVYLNEHNVIIEDIEIKKPSLEDYFVKMTARGK